MTIQVDAIYDGGVLKPLEPLALTDQTRVSLIVRPQAPPVDEASKAAAQKAALRELWAEIDKLPQIRNNDGWSVRKADELLYGDP